jgi:hypothetical protein
MEGFAEARWSAGHASNRPRRGSGLSLLDSASGGSNSAGPSDHAAELTTAFGSPKSTFVTLNFLHPRLPALHAPAHHEVVEPETVIRQLKRQSEHRQTMLLLCPEAAP